MSETIPHQPVMVEVTFPFHLGGNMTEGYRCFDQNMAQASIDVAVHSATLLERERIIKLLTDNDYVGAVTLIRLAERNNGETK